MSEDPKYDLGFLGKQRTGGLGFIHDELLNGNAKKKGPVNPSQAKKMASIDQEIATLESMYN
jgi:hypothetical protein